MNELPVPKDDLQVYLDWPEDHVLKELDTLRSIMFDGAGAPELQGARRCIDFLVRGSTGLSEATLLQAEVLDNEAHMRINLLEAKDAMDRDAAEVLKDVEKSIRMLKQNIQGIKRRFIDNQYLTDEEVHDHVKRRVLQNLGL